MLLKGQCSFSSHLLVILNLLPFLTCLSIQNASKDVKDPPCGGVLTEPSGYISYNPTSNYENNLRCIWTVAVEGTSYIVFQLEEYSSTDNHDGILITGIRKGEDTANFHVHKLNDTDTICQSFSNVAVVMFYSDETNVTNGFNLRYTTTKGESDVVLGQNWISSATPSDTVTRESYLNNELSTYVYAPGFTFSPTTQVTATFMTTGIEECCSCDFISAYSLNVYATDDEPTWTKSAIFCFDTQEQSFTSNDAVILVFESNGNTTGTGFTLTFEG